MHYENIIVIIPTYNEVENIAPLIEKIFSLGINLSVLVIDDNSPDGTSQCVASIQDKYPGLYLIRRGRRLGLGSAYKEGFQYALERGYDIIIQMDADLSHSPFYITKMIDSIDDYDLVIGSRYIKRGGVSDWSLVRILLSRAANIFTKILLGLPVNDLTSGFKCMKKDVLEKINFTTITSKGYAFQVEMLVRIFSKGFKIIEYPIVFKERRKNKSKITWEIIAEAFFIVVCLAFKNILKKIFSNVGGFFTDKDEVYREKN